MGWTLISDEFLAGVFRSDAGERRYKLFRPSVASLPEVGQRTLVVVLHGCTQDADDIARGTRFNSRAAIDGFIVLYPEQPVAANDRKCWNWFIPSQIGRAGGEVRILGEMTAALAKAEGIDPRRIFLTGISAGAAMAANLAVAYPDLFAAVAMHSGLAAGAAVDMASALAAMASGARDTDALGAAAFRTMGAHARVVPVMVVQGSADPAVSVRNLATTARQWVVTNALAAGAATPSEPTIIPPPASVARSEALVGSRYALADGTVLAETWRVEGLGHAWSGGSSEGSFTDPKAPDATALILDFFSRHPKR